MPRRRLAPLALTLMLGLPGLACESAEDDTVTQQHSDDAFPSGPYADRDPALAKQLVDGGALLLDVRTPEEFASGHVEGAVNIDHSEVSARLGEVRELVGGDPHKPVVLYCKSGRRAGLVRTELETAGFDRVTNLGGFSDWPG